MKHQDTENQITGKKAEALVKLARKSIAEHLGIDYQPGSDLESAVRDPVFQSRRATFVTLKINGQLRGCIGNLAPDKPLAQGVQENAKNAAFSDPRFPPLSKDEFFRTSIEVSLLTEPEPLEYKDYRDLLDKIRPGIDGVIIRKGPHSSTFLPQVWEQLPDRESFLANLCMKAGLAPDEWKKGGLEVYTYQVKYFEETDK